MRRHTAAASHSDSASDEAIQRLREVVVIPLTRHGQYYDRGAAKRRRYDDHLHTSFSFRKDCSSDDRRIVTVGCSWSCQGLQMLLLGLSMSANCGYGRDVHVSMHTSEYGRDSILVKLRGSSRIRSKNSVGKLDCCQGDCPAKTITWGSWSRLLGII